MGNQASINTESVDKKLVSEEIISNQINQMSNER